MERKESAPEPNGQTQKPPCCLKKWVQQIGQPTWKVMKDYEEYQGYTDVQGSRDAIRKALQMGIIEDTTWMSTISSRNLTSHCYDEEEFNMVFNQIIHDYLPIFNKFSEKMNTIKNSEK